MTALLLEQRQQNNHKLHDKLHSQFHKEHGKRYRFQSTVHDDDDGNFFVYNDHSEFFDVDLNEESNSNSNLFVDISLDHRDDEEEKIHNENHSQSNTKETPTSPSHRRRTSQTKQTMQSAIAESPWVLLLGSPEQKQQRKAKNHARRATWSPETLRRTLSLVVASNAHKPKQITDKKNVRRPSNATRPLPKNTAATKRSKQ